MLVSPRPINIESNKGEKLTYNGNPVRLSAESSIGLYKPEEKGMIYSTSGKEVSTNKNNRPEISQSDLMLKSKFCCSNESALCIKWPKYWSFSFNISPSSENLELISFRTDWFDLSAVQGTQEPPTTP